MDKCYCIFGDSVTQAPYVEIGWPELLRRFLEDKYTNDYIHVFSLGISGNTAEDILGRFESESAVRLPTTLIFAIGINDSKEDDEQEFRADLEEIIKQAKKITADIVFVGAVLGDWQEDDLMSKRKTDRYNLILSGVAQANQCRFISLQDTLADADFMDGLHPNDVGHRKMFEVIKTYF